MIASLLRVVFGLLLGCIAAAAMLALFVYPPLDLMAWASDGGIDAVVGATMWLLAVATHNALFAAPFAFIAAAFTEWFRARSPVIFGLIGMTIAAMGFLAQFSSEQFNEPSILNSYALTAYLAAGLAGGLIYWLAAGRCAGGRAGEEASVLGPAVTGDAGVPWSKNAEVAIERRVPEKTAPPAKPSTAAAIAPAAVVPVAAAAAAIATPAAAANGATAQEVKRPAFQIERTKTEPQAVRLVATETLDRASFYEIAKSMGVTPLTARKTGFVAARKATGTEIVVTHWNGKETTNAARQGDWIATNMTPDRDVLRDSEGNANTYVIKAETFPVLYETATGENEFGSIFAAKSVVDAIFLSGGFDILAPWGQKQTASSGYLMLNGKDVYGNNADTFSATYEIVD